MLTSRDFRGSRLLLAQLLLDGSKTASELAQALGKPTGSVFGVITRMVGDGILTADTESPARGTRYSLSVTARQVLRAMERQPTAPGAIAAGQQLLLIEPPARITEVQEVLAQDWIAGLVVWAVEVGGGWLLALDAENTYPMQRLRMALEAVGAASQDLSARSVLSGEELRDRAEWLLDDVRQSR